MILPFSLPTVQCGGRMPEKCVGINKKQYFASGERKGFMTILFREKIQYNHVSTVSSKIESHDIGDSPGQQEGYKNTEGTV